MSIKVETTKIIKGGGVDEINIAVGPSAVFDKIVIEPLSRFVMPIIFKCAIIFTIPKKKHKDITRLSEKCLRKFQRCTKIFMF